MIPFAQGLSDVESGAITLAAGARELKAGASELESGARDLRAGMSELSFGGHTLAAGTRELQDAVGGIDEEIVDKLQEAVDEKMAGPDPLRSFVDPANENVRAVQFVYVIEGIESQSDTAPVQAEEEPQGLFERLMALFTLP